MKKKENATKPYERFKYAVLSKAPPKYVNIEFEIMCTLHIHIGQGKQFHFIFKALQM